MMISHTRGQVPPKLTQLQLTPTKVCCVLTTLCFRYHNGLTSFFFQSFWTQGPQNLSSPDVTPELAELVC